MAKKNKKVTQKDNKRNYQNPSETIWGKVLIWLILIGMIGGAVVGLIIAIAQML